MVGLQKRIFVAVLLTWFVLSWSNSLGYGVLECFACNTAGAGIQTIGYTPNELRATSDRNQYFGITTPSSVLTTGRANAAASVTINGQPAAKQQNFGARSIHGKISLSLN